MRIAITTLNGRVSPLFDSASRLLVAELDRNRECSRFETAISEPFLYSKVMRLRELGAETLICGAISEQGASMITTAGIELIPWISGQVEEVLQAFLEGNLFDTQVIMPKYLDYWQPCRGRASRRHDFRLP